MRALDIWRAESREIKTAGGDPIPVRDLGEANLIFHSAGNAIFVTLDDMVLVPGCRQDPLSMEARDYSGKGSVGEDGVIYLLYRDVKFPVGGGSSRKVA